MRNIIVFIIYATSFNLFAVDHSSEKHRGFIEEHDKINMLYSDSSDRLEALEACGRNGNYICSFMIGKFYYNLKNYKKAFEGFLAASKADHWGANLMLGYMYNEGNGVLQDNKKAIKYLKKTLIGGNYEEAKEIAYDIHVIYYNNYDIADSKINAYAWLKVSMALGKSKVKYVGSDEKPIENVLYADGLGLGAISKVKAEQLARDICSNIDGCNQ